MPVPVPPEGKPTVNKAVPPKAKPIVKGSAAADKPVTPKSPTMAQNRTSIIKNQISRAKEAREEHKAKMARVKNK